MSERALGHFGKYGQKWIMCPSCRQRTYFENIAYVVEKKNKETSPTSLNSHQTKNVSESSITVKGSYGTKVLSCSLLYLLFHVCASTIGICSSS